MPFEFNDLFIKGNCEIIYDAKELLLTKNRDLDEGVADTIYQSEELYEKLVKSFEKKKLTNVVSALENDNISILELADCITSISSQVTVGMAENVLGGYIFYNITYIVDVEKMKKLGSVKS